MNKIIISFIAFCGIVAICRHIVSDIKQEERIVVLENLVEELYRRNESYNFISSNDCNEYASAATETTLPTKSAKSNKNIVSPSSENRKNNRRNDTLKFSSPILLELNTIDSATLVKIPGIGAKTASIIINYRNRLGGFYSPYQISEKLTWDGAQEHMNDWCNNWLKADQKLIRKIDINKADFKQILRHPYLNYEQTKAIVNYRDKHKTIKDISFLKMLEEFDQEDINKLEYYLDSGQ